MGRDRQGMYSELGPSSQSTGPEGPKYANEYEVRKRFPRLSAKFPES